MSDSHDHGHAHENVTCTVEAVSPVQRDLRVELSADEAAKAHVEITESYISRAKLPGFRPGKAPVDIVLQKFGHEIEHEVIDRLVPEALHRALEQHAIRAVGIPSVRDVSYKPGEALRFTAVVETWPEFDLPPYKKLKLKKREETVSEEDVDRTVEDLRRKQAEYLPVENRGIQDGDYVSGRIQGRDLKSKRLMPAEKIVVVAGHPSNDPALNANLAGLKPGEEKSFDYAYPADFPNKKFAGKTIAYALKVESLREMVLPEINEEFAKRLGEESMDAVRDKVRAELLSLKRQEVLRETSRDAIQSVIDQAHITLPESVVQEEMEVVLKNIASRIQRRGVTREEAEAIRNQSRVQAEQNIKEHLVIKKIAQAEGFIITEEDVDAEIKSIAESNGLPLARVMDTFREEGRRDGLKSTLLARRTVDYLVGQSIRE
ncbi:MAG: trigger factor [Candidatus Aminicenantes bacterium]|nr:trigger factor [Candidatus Aminicenantes bacterium]